MVLCDGIACDFFVWKYVLRYFHPHFRILRWNFRGHGKSQAPRDFHNLTIPDLVRDLGGILAEEGIDKPILVAHSMGVQVILEFFRFYPDRVAALVPMCGSYQYPLDTFHESTILKQLLPFLRLGVRTSPRATRLFQKLLTPDLQYAIGRWVELNRERAYREDMFPYFSHITTLDLNLFLTMLHYASLHSADEVLERVDVPTLIFAATKDSFTPGRLSQDMHQRIRGSELCVIRDGSHAAPVEFPELVNLRLEKFLIEKGFLKQ
jgi:pimeloyl-ACP methyl ester carboxylesterase